MVIGALILLCSSQSRVRINNKLILFCKLHLKSLYFTLVLSLKFRFSIISIITSYNLYMFRYRTSATPESTDRTKEHSGDNEHENETVEQ